MDQNTNAMPPAAPGNARTAEALLAEACAGNADALADMVGDKVPIRLALRAITTAMNAAVQHVTPAGDGGSVEWDGATRTMREHLYLMTGERDRYKALYKQVQEQVRALAARIAEASGGTDPLQSFKDYVHRRLDAMGVPIDPESPHKAAGCRIGGRLDWIEQRLPATPAGRGDAIAPEPYAWGYTNLINGDKGITLNRAHRVVEGYSEHQLVTLDDAANALAPQLVCLRWLEERFAQIKTSASEQVMEAMGLHGDATEPLADLVERAMARSGADA